MITGSAEIEQHHLRADLGDAYVVCKVQGHAPHTEKDAQDSCASSEVIRR
jgi:hypothetical protein